MSSEQVLKAYWEKKGSIDELVNDSDFLYCRWEDLPRIEYAVITYTWTSPWYAIVNALQREHSELPDYFWIDVFCQDQTSKYLKTVIRRTAEIYGNACSYHVMGAHCFARGWCLYEVAVANARPIFYTIFFPELTEQQYTFVHELRRRKSYKPGITIFLEFHQCSFRRERDRAVIRRLIVKRFGSEARFNSHCRELVEKYYCMRNVLERLSSQHDLRHE